MFQYLPLDISDLPIMVELYKKYLNDGPSIEGYLKEGFESDGYIGFKCLDEYDNVCGVFSTRIGIDFTCEHFALVNKIKENHSNKKIYTADMLVVLPEYRHFGIAYELVLKLKNKLIEYEVDLFLVELWREPDGRLPGKVILDWLGKEIEHTFYPDFYKDIAKYELTCPICGTNCICGADICLIELIKDNGRFMDEHSKKKVNTNKNCNFAH